MSLGTAAVAEALPTAKLASASQFRFRLWWLFNFQKYRLPASKQTSLVLKLFPKTRRNSLFEICLLTNFLRVEFSSSSPPPSPLPSPSKSNGLFTEHLPFNMPHRQQIYEFKSGVLVRRNPEVTITHIISSKKADRAHSRHTRSKKLRKLQGIFGTPHLLFWLFTYQLQVNHASSDKNTISGSKC